LFTIVPLRAANSKTLVEQSIGRGLRLPYGKRTGEIAVDSLFIIAHDRFQEIVDQANDPNSLIRANKVLGENEHGERIVVEDSKPALVERTIEAVTKSLAPTIKVEPARVAGLVHATREAMRELTRLPSTRDLSPAQFQEQVVTRVQQAVTPGR